MTTLLTAIFYLWLATTILLAATWILRRHDRLRTGPLHDPDHASANGDHGFDGLQADKIRAADDVRPADDVRADEHRAADERDRVDGPGDTAEIGHPSGDGRRPVAVASHPGPTVLELLDGAVLPYDLTPVTGRLTEPERHVIFLSPNPDAEAVGTAFADELDRLGYSIEPDGLDGARATRGDNTLLLRIRPNAGTVPDGQPHRYPTAGPSDVAIEIWTGQGGPPPLS